MSNVWLAILKKSRMGTYSLTKEPECFVLILLLTVLPILPPQVDAPFERASNKGLGSIPGALFICDVIFHSGAWVNLELSWL